MEQVFSYIISLGASVMMPILFTIIGLCIGMKFGKSLKSGLYVEDNPHERKQVKFTKYAFFYLDYDHEWIWLRDQKDEYGAFFLHKDDKFTLIAAETPQMKPSTAEKDGVGYLRLTGSSNGPSQYIEIHAFKNAKRIERFTALQVLGEISECTLNGRDITQEAGKAYLANLPQFKEMTGYFKDINEE